MSKKIVFFDIDGTIYDYTKGIPDTTYTAIKQLRENGHLAIVCTGRTRIMIFEDILKLGFDGIIAGGGTYVEYNNKMIFDYSLPRELIIEVVEQMRENGFIPIPEGRENMYFDVDELNDKFQSIYNIYKEALPNNILPIDYSTINAAKVSARFTERSNLNAIIKRLNNKFTFVNHNDELLELIPIDYSKAIGVEKLINYLKIDRRNTFAFGDSFNDLEMLQYVEYGIAMGNAHPDLKNIIKYHTNSIFEDGIFHGLKKFALI